MKQALQRHDDANRATGLITRSGLSYDDVSGIVSFAVQGTHLQAEYGKWKNWYRGDWLTGIYRTREVVQVFSKFLDDPLTHLAPPVLRDGWEAYYHIMHYEGIGRQR